MFVKNLMNNKTGTGVVLVVSNTINNLGFNKVANIFRFRLIILANNQADCKNVLRKLNWVIN